MGDILLALAERCEQSQGPCRDLDAAIDVAVSGDAGAWVVEAKVGSMFSHKPGWWRDSDDKSHLALEYTGSLDAAMMLLPNGCSANIFLAKDRECAAQVHHFLPGSLIPHKQSLSRGERPAIALTAASLRALATAEKS